MTPIQKLVALRELLNQPGTHAADVEALLADVHLPPPELFGLDDPEAWAKALAGTVANLSEPTALAWMLGAMSAAGTARGRAGYYSGRQDADASQLESRAALVGALRLVLDLIARRTLNPPMIRDQADPDNPPITLREHLVGVLRSAGEAAE